MNRIFIYGFSLIFIAGSVFLSGMDKLSAQERVEPELAELEAPMSHMDFDIRNGVGFRLQLNNFGFAFGGEYRRVLSRNTKGLLEIQITNVKDEREQTFQSLWGYSVIPNKHNRILAFPAMIGLQRRLFANHLSDNFRLLVQLSGGPAPAFVYPYYDHDRYGVGLRLPDQQHYDPFQGWGDGEFVWGAAGQFSIGVDIGGDFANIQTVRLGYYFHYFPDGVQVMEPLRIDFSVYDRSRPISDQPPGAFVTAADKQSFFGTPHITFVFGTMW